MAAADNITNCKTIIEEFFQLLDHDSQAIKQSNGYAQLKSKKLDSSYAKPPLSNSPLKNTVNIADTLKNLKKSVISPYKKASLNQKENSPFKRAKTLKKQASAIQDLENSIGMTQIGSPFKPAN